jgi:hypothetical protein
LFRLSAGLAVISLAGSVGWSATGGASSAAAPDWGALLQKVRGLDTTKPEAVGVLRDVVAELILVQEAKSKELEALRAEVQALRARVPVPTATSGSRGAARSTSAAAASPAASKAAATAAAPAALFGKPALKKLHRADCQFGSRIKEAERVYFKSVGDATAAGFEACKVCKPDSSRG